MKNERVIVAGISGAGKTTFAERLSKAWSIPHIEMDALYHGENWVPRESFLNDVKLEVDKPGWVVDSLGHKESKQLLWPRTTRVIWLDYPRRTIFYRVFTRSVHRAATKKVLWNGNMESWKGWLDPEHPVQTLFRQYKPRKKKIQGLIDAKKEPFELMHFTSAATAERWLKGQELTSPRK